MVKMKLFVMTNNMPKCKIIYGDGTTINVLKDGEIIRVPCYSGNQT